MKYVAVSLLCLASMLSLASSPAPTAGAALVTVGDPQADPLSADSAGALDPLLMALLAGALAALQLRRRQKSLRTPTLRL